MTVLVSVIIVTISSNISLSLGMVGALSIVRYRTAVKNPLDLMFMFWAITSGITIGARFYHVAIISFFFIIAKHKYTSVYYCSQLANLLVYNTIYLYIFQ